MTWDMTSYECINSDGGRWFCCWTEAVISSEKNALQLSAWRVVIWRLERSRECYLSSWCSAPRNTFIRNFWQCREPERHRTSVTRGSPYRFVLQGINCCCRCNKTDQKVRARGHKLWVKCSLLWLNWCPGCAWVYFAPTSPLPPEILVVFTP